MAQKTTVTLTDDIDGGEATQTVKFSYKGRQYEIDLSDKNAGKLEKALEPYVSAGRRSTSNASSMAGRRGGQSSSPTDVHPRAVREWAQANGIDVSARGRISAQVVEQFRAAGN